ncbi:ABC transporter ATP-binding protein [Rhizobium sp. C4]|nr:ABC transporter ATP-binding protein [Rhizobium sp. C4]MCD2176045.1 ABC transporter ATP-binding protein [Rhizobium sp. C4]
MANAPQIAVRELRASYGPSQALYGMTFEVDKGELVTLLGRNGAGKTTTMRSIMGLIPRSGSIKIAGTEVTQMPPEKIARLGIAYCPEERGIFSSLSVEENLLLPPILHPGGLATEEIYELFPRLKERRSSQGTKLSGGEQQMLAIARILRTGAKCLLLDEPTEGLAPVIVDHIGDIIAQLKKRGYTILMIEQSFDFALQLSDRLYVVENGKIVAGAIAEHARRDASEILALLSV